MSTHQIIYYYFILFITTISLLFITSMKYLTSVGLILLLNTFASQRFVFEGKNEVFLLENTSNLTHEFLYDNFNKKM